MEKTSEMRNKLKERMRELENKGNIIVYIDTDSIMYIDDKLNLIEEDINKL